MFTPHKELLLDESIDVFTWEVGFPSIHQKKKKKRNKSGIKFLELCTNDGSVLKTEIYSGQKLQDPQPLGKTGAAVLPLMGHYRDKCYHLLTDN